jgi:hypothetical protein
VLATSGVSTALVSWCDKPYVTTLHRLSSPIPTQQQHTTHSHNENAPAGIEFTTLTLVLTPRCYSVNINESSQVPLLSKSAWACGPPQNSATSTPSRSQSPAPPTPISVTNLANFYATRSRHSSILGQGVSIKDGVNIPRNAVEQGMSIDLCSPPLPQLVVLPGSAATFGSIDDASAPISSSPASAPAVNLRMVLYLLALLPSRMASLTQQCLRLLIDHHLFPQPLLLHPLTLRPLLPPLLLFRSSTRRASQNSSRAPPPNTYQPLPMRWRPPHRGLRRYLHNTVKVNLIRQIFPLVPCAKDKMVIPLHPLSLPYTRAPWQMAKPVVSASVVDAGPSPILYHGPCNTHCGKKLTCTLTLEASWC